MCVDLVNAQLSVQKYEDMFPAFSDSRECKLIKVRNHFGVLLCFGVIDICMYKERIERKL